MPTWQQWHDYVNDMHRTPEELQQACALLGLSPLGNAQQMRARLNNHINQQTLADVSVCPLPGQIGATFTTFENRIAAIEQRFDTLTEAGGRLSIADDERASLRDDVNTIGKAHPNLNIGTAGMSRRERWLAPNKAHA